jgi:hypothetical protein
MVDPVPKGSCIGDVGDFAERSLHDDASLYFLK